MIASLVWHLYCIREGLKKSLNFGHRPNHLKFGNLSSSPEMVWTPKVYILLASLVDKAPTVVVYERLEVSINVTIMISTIGMVHQLPFYVNIQTFFTQTFLDSDHVSKLFSLKKFVFKASLTEV